MAKIIIGIHGLGNKPSAEVLESWWKAAIDEGIKTHLNDARAFTFHMVYWADVFYEKPLNEILKDRDDPFYLEEKYIPASDMAEAEEHPLRQKVLDVLEKQLDSIFLNDDLTINFSFIGDSIIKRYFRELDYYYARDLSKNNENGQSARELVGKRLINILKAHQEDEILLIAHSMGSIIAYDVLNFFSDGIKLHTFVTIGSPLGFPVIMGKIATGRNIEYPFPVKLKTPRAVTDKWYNLSDLEDKIALIYKLGENFDPNDQGVNVIDKIVNNNYSINGERNPHKSFGYLRTPEMVEIITTFLNSRSTGNFDKFIRRISKRFSNLLGR